MYANMDAVRRANRDAGHYFFEPETMRFFASRVGETLYAGRYFVSSERGHGRQRRYTVREALPDGSIEPVGRFQEHATRAAAIAAIRRLRPLWSRVP